MLFTFQLSAVEFDLMLAEALTFIEQIKCKANKLNLYVIA